MAKFNVGDMVKVIKVDNDDLDFGIKLGDIGIYQGIDVDANYGSYSYVRFDNFDHFCIPNDYITKVTPATIRSVFKAHNKENLEELINDIIVLFADTLK